jgi:hypothetical protein
MNTNNPNRVKTQISNLDQNMHKKSGDQHIEPQDETEESPHRPHRVNREDMQKMVTPPKDTDEDSQMP